MDLTRKNKVLVWLSVILLIGNITLVTTIILSNVSPTERTNIRKDSRHKKRGDRMGDYLASQLNLTADQQEKYNNAKSKYFKKQRELRKQIHTQKQNIHEELFKINPDTNAIMHYSDSIGKLNAAFEKGNYLHFMQIKEILNEEQIDKLQQLLNHQSFTGKNYRHRKGRNRQ